jgi:hypothetical protein
LKSKNESQDHQGIYIPEGDQVLLTPLEVGSKPQIRFNGKAQADEEA